MFRQFARSAFPLWQGLLDQRNESDGQYRALAHAAIREFLHQDQLLLFGRMANGRDELPADPREKVIGAADQNGLSEQVHGDENGGGRDQQNGEGRSPRG